MEEFDRDTASDSSSRQDIVSSLINLTETICEKALELEGAEGLVKRTKELQKKSKRKEQPGSGTVAKQRATVKNDVEVSCCLMEPGRKGYVRSSPLYDVDLNKTDSYEVVISKICRSIGEEMSDNFRVFNAKGAIIPNQKIALRDKEVNWTLGGYLQKRHTSPDKITLGIGMLEDEPQPKRVKVNDCVRNSVPKNNEVCFPTEADESDVLEVYYAGEDEIVPLTRSEVWEEINGLENAMDKNGIFLPESSFYRVVSIILSRKNGNKMTILRPSASGVIRPCHSEGISPFCFTSCTKPVITSAEPVPLIALGRCHPDCTYQWECVGNRNSEFPSTPVIYISKPLLYKCCIIVQGHPEGLVHFDVSYQPATDVTHIDEDDHLHYSPPCDISCQSQPSCELLSMAAPRVDSLEFSVEEIIIATNYLDKGNELGRGGYGSVYLANNLRCIGTKAAVKVLTKEGSDALVRGGEASAQIQTELKALMKFRHPNILDIMGFCFSVQMKAIVYAYIENGSLYSWIHSVRSSELGWPLRTTIVKDVFRGVGYLHAGGLVHQDIKSSNILLDKDFKAVVGDFGFSLELPQKESGRTLITAPLIARTEGYFPPELLSGKISPLSDIYSCGVLTLETYTGLKPYCSKREDHELVGHTEDDRVDIAKFREISDSRVLEKINDEDCKRYMSVVNSCLLRYTKRPTANEVLQMFD